MHSRASSPGLRPLALAMLFGLALGPALRGAIYTVGAGGAPCSTGTVAAALLSAAFNPGPDEIRVARNQTYTNQYLHLVDWSPATTGHVTIAGGYDDCADTTANGTTTLGGQLSNPVVEIDTVSEPTSEVTLRGLVLRDSGEEGLLVEGGGRVLLDDVTIRNNSAGGMAVYDGAEANVDSISEIHLNDGAGITCFNSSRVDVAANVHNNSGVAGGGLLAGSGCEMNVLPGAWIQANDAAFGAGIFASSGATVIVSGVAAGGFQTQIALNTATDQGGGIYATGAGTTVIIRNAFVTGNEAGDEGGGIWAFDDAVVVMDRVDGSCYDLKRCSSLSTNSLTTGTNGAAVFAGGGADVSVFQTYVDSNSIPPASILGSVMYATGTGSTLTLEGVGFWNNQGPDTLLEGDVNAVVAAAFVSASRNFYNTGTTHARPIALSGGASGYLNSSIFWPSTEVFGGAGIVEADCLILSTSVGLPGGGTFISTVDPQFQNPAVGNLRLPGFSTAVDYCDTVLYTPAHFDIDHTPRGFNYPGSVDGSPGPTGGVYDLGFDEFRPLFADGFESGNTLAWSLDFP